MCEDEVAELIAQGRYALWSSGDFRTARAWFERAWTRADQQDQPEAKAAAALGLGGLWVREHREDAAWPGFWPGSSRPRPGLGERLLIRPLIERGR